jgi:hypothetical protein
MTDSQSHAGPFGPPSLKRRTTVAARREPRPLRELTTFAKRIMSRWLHNIASHTLLWPLTAFLSIVLFGPEPLSAREPIREFLDGLRFRGYHDTALDYVDRLAERKDLPQALAETLDYERAVTLEMAAVDDISPEKKGQFLDRALSHLRTFLQRHPDHPLAATARFRIGAVLVTRAGLLTEQLDGQRNSPDANPLADKAREMFDEAHAVYVSLQQWLREKLVALPPHLDPVEDAGLIDERNRLRSSYVETQLLKAKIIQRKAETYPDGSTTRLKSLAAAAAEYREIYTKYKSLMAGLYARLYEGACYEEAGDVDAALEVYGELLEIEATANPVFELKTKALKAAFDCWLNDGRKDFAIAVQQGERWLEGAEAVQLEDATAVQVIERLCQAYRHLAELPATERLTAAQYRDRATELDRKAADLKKSWNPIKTAEPPYGPAAPRGD